MSLPEPAWTAAERRPELTESRDWLTGSDSLSTSSSSWSPSWISRAHAHGHRTAWRFTLAHPNAPTSASPSWMTMVPDSTRGSTPPQGPPSEGSPGPTLSRAPVTVTRFFSPAAAT